MIAAAAIGLVLRAVVVVASPTPPESDGAVETTVPAPAHKDEDRNEEGR